MNHMDITLKAKPEHARHDHELSLDELETVSAGRKVSGKSGQEYMMITMTDLLVTSH